MATQTVTFSYQTGKTLTLKLYALSADTIAATASVTERSNQLGVYAAVFTDVTPGTYRAVVFLGSVPVYSGFVNLAATTATFEVDGLTAIGTAFLSTALTKGDPGTIERAFWQMLRTQAVTDGTAVADAGNTVTQFRTTLTAPDGQYDHMILAFVSSGLDGEVRPIDTYVQANGVITLQEPLTEIPTGDEEFVILPQHAHPISEIQAGLATSANQAAILSQTLMNFEILAGGKVDAVLVDQDYGGAGNLTYTINGQPVNGADILVYRASDYNAGNRSNDFIVAASRQLSDGRWQQAVRLEPGSYKLQFFKQRVAGPDTFDLVVE